MRGSCVFTMLKITMEKILDIYKRKKNPNIWILKYLFLKENSNLLKLFILWVFHTCRKCILIIITPHYHSAASPSSSPSHPHPTSWFFSLCFLIHWVQLLLTQSMYMNIGLFIVAQSTCRVYTPKDNWLSIPQKSTVASSSPARNRDSLLSFSHIHMGLLTTVTLYSSCTSTYSCGDSQVL